MDDFRSTQKDVGTQGALAGPSTRQRSSAVAVLSLLSLVFAGAAGVPGTLYLNAYGSATMYRGFHAPQQEVEGKPVRWARHYTKVEFRDSGWIPVRVSAWLRSPDEAPPHGTRVIVSVNDVPIRQVRIGRTWEQHDFEIERPFITEGVLAVQFFSETFGDAERGVGVGPAQVSPILPSRYAAILAAFGGLAGFFVWLVLPIARPFRRQVIYGAARDSGATRALTHLLRVVSAGVRRLLALKALLPLVTAALAVVYLYPDLLLLKKNVMLATTSELQDPVVSTGVYLPGRRIIRYEWLKNGSFLWSNLSAMGLPVFGNEVQLAPLFPLTLPMIFLPELLYWDFYTLVRLTLLVLGAFLIGRELLGLKKHSSFVFALIIALGLWVVRWNNHAWTNGYLACLYYIYFLATLPTVPAKPSAKWGRFLGLTLSAYSMVTCGFPEASALGAILTLLVIPPYVIHGSLAGKIHLKVWFLHVAIAHLLALGLSSFQLASLVEFLGTTSSTFRGTIGTIQLRWDPKYFASMITLLNMNGNPPSIANVHVFGLIPTLLFLLAIPVFIWKPRRVSLPEGIAVGCLVFFLLKVFPIWPAFNKAIASLPVLNQTWFTVYFLPLLLWPVAHFSARGFEFFVERDEGEAGLSTTARGWIFALGALLFFASLFHLAPYVESESLTRILKSQKPQVALTSTILYFGFTGLVVWHFVKRRSPRTWATIFAVFLIVTETRVIRFENFYRTSAYETAVQVEPSLSQIRSLSAEAGIPLIETRLRDQVNPWEGNWLEHGVAMVDNGTAAIYPERLRLFRAHLFKSEWNGYLPIEFGRFDYSWRLASNGLFLATPERATAPEMSAYGLKDLGEVRPGVRLYWDPQTLPRAYIPRRCFPSSSMDQSLREVTRSPGFVLGDAWVEDLTEGEAALCGGWRSERVGRVRILADSGSAIELEPIQGPAVVVLNDTYYPGWQAVEVGSGQEIPVRPGNLTFRIVFLPEARSYHLKFAYRPAWWLPCLFFTLTSLAVLIAGTLVNWGHLRIRGGPKRP